MLVFEERGNSNRRKTSRSRVENKQQTQPTFDAGSGNRTRDTAVGGERSHHCANPAPQFCSRSDRDRSVGAVVSRQESHFITS